MWSRRNTAGMVLQPQRGRLHAAQTRGSVQSDDPQQWPQGDHWQPYSSAQWRPERDHHKDRSLVFIEIFDFIFFSVAGLVETCLFVWGSAGTGKTLILMEALKIKMSKLLSLGRRVRILATTYYDNTSELRKKFVDNYLVNMKNIEVMDLQKLCCDLNVDYDYYTPRETVNRVIRSLSDSSDHVTIILMDEVWPCNHGQPTSDWRDLEVRENVIWLLGLSPKAPSASSTEVLPPENSFVLTRHLVHKHRNCPQIRNFIKTINTKLFIWNIYLILVL